MSILNTLVSVNHSNSVRLNDGVTVVDAVISDDLLKEFVELLQKNGCRMSVSSVKELKGELPKAKAPKESSGNRSSYRNYGKKSTGKASSSKTRKPVEFFDYIEKAPLEANWKPANDNLQIVASQSEKQSVILVGDKDTTEVPTCWWYFIGQAATDEWNALISAGKLEGVYPLTKKKLGGAMRIHCTGLAIVDGKGEKAYKFATSVESTETCKKFIEFLGQYRLKDGSFSANKCKKLYASCNEARKVKYDLEKETSGCNTADTDANKRQDSEVGAVVVKTTAEKTSTKSSTKKSSTKTSSEDAPAKTSSTKKSSTKTTKSSKKTSTTKKA